MKFVTFTRADGAPLHVLVDNIVAVEPSGETPGVTRLHLDRNTTFMVRDTCETVLDHWRNRAKS